MKKSTVPATIFIFLLDFLKAIIRPIGDIISSKTIAEFVLFVQIWVKPKTSLNKNINIFSFYFLHISLPIDLLIRSWLWILLIFVSFMAKGFFF